jgi:3-oxoacyl-[acyl-carrier protein] reductase
LSLFLQTGFVTGASGSLGSVVSRALAALGASLLLHYYRDAKALAKLTADIGPAVVGTLSLDLSQAGAAEACLPLLERLPRLDFAVLCHGATRYAALPTLTDEEIHALVQLNLVSHLELARLVYDRLRRSHGTLLFVGSQWGERGAAAEAPYAAAKGGLPALALSLRAELAPDGVRVAVVLPGAFESAMTAGRQPPAHLPTTSAQAVAAEVCHALLSTGPLPPRIYVPRP